MNGFNLKLTCLWYSPVENLKSHFDGFSFFSLLFLSRTGLGKATPRPAKLENVKIFRPLIFLTFLHTCSGSSYSPASPIEAQEPPSFVCRSELNVVGGGGAHAQPVVLGGLQLGAGQLALVGVLVEGA